jgi:hypothetical protein
MRPINQSLAVLTLLMGALAGGFTSASAQQFNIFPVNKVWKYMAVTNPPTFCLDGSGWETSPYDDSLWPSGPGGFTGGENTAATLTSLAGLLNTTTLPAPNGGGGRPQYFRTHFNVTTAAGLTLTLSNRIDDNAVFYINGTRVANVRYTADPESCATFGAQNAAGEATTWDVVVLTPTQLAGILVNGDNVLAVSVHQVNATSSDMVFACILTGENSTPASITDATGLTNRTVLQCKSTALSVVAGGTAPLTYQWFHDGSPILNATTPTYTIASMQAADAGAYHVTVANASGSATSSPDTQVNYVADTVPPTIIYAVGNSDLTTITINFGEAVNTNALASIPATYQLFDNGAASTIAGAAALGNQTIVLTNSPARNPTHTYTLHIVQADACAGNVLDTTITLNTFVNAIGGLADTWKYYDGDDTNARPELLTAAWYQTAYDDSAWPSGPGPFDAKRNGGFPALPSNCRTNGVITNYFGNGTVSLPYTCVALTSPRTGTNAWAVNFRRHFTFSGNPADTILRLRGKADDGALFYLNGSELRGYYNTATAAVTDRLGLPAFPAVILRDGTAATRTVNDPDGLDILDFVAPSQLLAGDNILAVEVRQVNLTSSDLTMGFAIEAVARAPLAVGPHLSIVLNPNGSVTMSWSGGGTLICTDDPTQMRTTWTPVVGAVSPHTFAAGALAAHRFYAVQVP